jgi:malonyl-CoA O-methyltransferase
LLKRLLRRRWGNPPTTLASLDAYALWAAQYPAHAHNLLMETEERAMLELMPTLEGQTILDLACGTGRYLQLVTQRAGTFALGADNSQAMLRAGKQTLPTQRWVCAAVDAIPLPDASCDGVICGLALGHIPQVEDTLLEMSRILKPDGWAVISDFHPFVFMHGGKRTFTAAGGQTYAVEHYPHLYATYHGAAARAGLTIEKVLEPTLIGDRGKQVQPLTPSGTPVVIVYRLRKSI